MSPPAQVRRASPYDIAPERFGRDAFSYNRRRCLARRFRPGGLDPVRRGGRLVVTVARLRPVRRRGDVADRDGDDPIGIPNRELILRQVLGKTSHGILVALVV